MNRTLWYRVGMHHDLVGRDRPPDRNPAHELRSPKSARASRPLQPPPAAFTTSEPFRPVVRSVYADGDTVIVVWDGRGMAIDGLPYENSYVWIMRLNDGQVSDGTAFYDSISFNDLWARVQPD